MRGRGLVVGVILTACSAPPSRPWNDLPEAARGGFLEAESAWEHAQGLPPGDPRRAASLGVALQQLDRVLETAPVYFRAHYLRQRTLLEIDPSAAAAEYPVLDVPDRPAALTLAGAMLLPDRPHRAAWILERATRLDPDFAWAWYGLAFVERSRGNHAEALIAAERATELLPDFPEALDLLVRIEESLGLRTETLETYARLLEARPGDPRLRHRLARRLLQSDDPRESRLAEQELRHALRLIPAPVPHSMAALEISIRVDLGLALFLDGRLEEAAGEYRTALELEPGNLDAWYNLGFVLERLGRDREALDAYEQYVSRWHAAQGVTAGQLRDRFSQVPAAIRRLRERLGLEPPPDAAGSPADVTDPDTSGGGARDGAGVEE